MYDQNDSLTLPGNGLQRSPQGTSNYDAVEAARAKIAGLGDFDPIYHPQNTPSSPSGPNGVVAPGAHMAYPASPAPAPTQPVASSPQPLQPSVETPIYSQNAYAQPQAPASQPQTQPMPPQPAPVAYQQYQAAPQAATPQPAYAGAPAAAATMHPSSPLQAPRPLSPLQTPREAAPVAPPADPKQAERELAAALSKPRRIGSLFTRRIQAPATPGQPEKKGGVSSRAKPVMVAVGIFILALVLTKSPVIISQLQYSGQKPSPAVTATPAAVVSPEPTISIPKLNVNAPVVYEPSIREEDVQRSLQSGVVHYGTTARPGEKGNAVIFGHSSNDWWEPGDYKFVFVLLDKLQAGDQVMVNYEGRRYTYEVTGSRVVEPTEISVLNPTKEPTLTLITCTPPGTAWKRLVVTAKQIDPAPSTATATKKSKSAEAQLPGSESKEGFWDQVQSVWKDFSGTFSGTPEAKPKDGPSSQQLPGIE